MLSRTIDDCNIHYSGLAGKFGGTIIEQCGVYKVEGLDAEQVECEFYPVSSGAAGKPNYTDSQVKYAARLFCDNRIQLDSKGKSSYNTFVVPNTEKAKDKAFMEAELGREGINLVVNGVSVCTGDPPVSDFDVSGTNCERRMEKIMNICPRYQGEKLVAWTTNGCVTYTFQPKGVLINNKAVVDDENWVERE